VDILLPLLLLVGLSFKGKADTAKQLEFFPESLALSKNYKQLSLIVEILNPTKRSLTIDYLFLTINVGKTNIGRIEKAVPFKIEKIGRTKVKFPIKINPIGFGKLVAYILKGNSPVFIIKGKGSSRGIQFPVYKRIAGLI